MDNIQSEIKRERKEGGEAAGGRAGPARGTGHYQASRIRVGLSDPSGIRSAWDEVAKLEQGVPVVPTNALFSPRPIRETRSDIPVYRNTSNFELLIKLLLVRIRTAWISPPVLIPLEPIIRSP